MSASSSASLACVLVWLLIWRTRLGYEIRAYGHSEPGARYAGISPTKITMIAMLISGGLAGMMAINNVMGEAERLVLNSTEGAGFIGIAVALMGRSHPLGVFLAAILFGFLYQGGAELALWTTIPRELIVVIQALVILFTGALDNMVRMPLERIFLSLRRREELSGWTSSPSSRCSISPCVSPRRCCWPASPGSFPNARASSTSGWRARC